MDGNGLFTALLSTLGLVSLTLFIVVIGLLIYTLNTSGHRERRFIAVIETQTGELGRMADYHQEMLHNFRAMEETQRRMVESLTRVEWTFQRGQTFVQNQHQEGARFDVGGDVVGRDATVGRDKERK